MVRVGKYDSQVLGLGSVKGKVSKRLVRTGGATEEGETQREGPQEEV